MPGSNWCLAGFDSLFCLSASDWAAWVQALGSIAAIAIAVAIPWMIHTTEQRDSRRERKLRAKSFALALLPGLEHTLGNLREARWRYRDAVDPDDFEYITERLVVPELLVVHQTNLHELGEVGSLLQDALAGIPSLRTLFNDHEFYARYGGLYVESDGTEHDIPEPPDPTPMVDKAITEFEKALGAVRGLFGPGDDPDRN